MSGTGPRETGRQAGPGKKKNGPSPGERGERARERFGPRSEKERERAGLLGFGPARRETGYLGWIRSPISLIFLSLFFFKLNSN